MDLWVGKIPRRRKWKPAPVFLPEKFLGQRNVVGCSAWGLKDLDMAEHASTRAFGSVSQFSCSVMSNSATPWTAAHQASLSTTNSQSRSNSCPLSQQCYPTISSSVVPFSSCLQFFLASGSFPVSQFFISGGQRIGASASTSVLPMNIQD